MQFSRTVTGEVSAVRVSTYSEVECAVRGHGGVDHVPSSGVGHPLGLARGTGGVEDEEGVLRVHGLAGAVRASLRSDK